MFIEGIAQPEPCGVDAMTSTCLEACVVCDINGFTGTNNLTVQGQTFPGFCTTIFHNMSYIAFVAGTENLTINVSVSNCTINRGVEIGIFESLDCQTFTPMTDCNTDVSPNATATFSNLVPLEIGQYYYLILDGSMGDICDWTFNVVEGSTEVGALTTSGMIEGAEALCPALSTSYSTTGAVGATFFNWTVNGVVQTSESQEIDISFPSDGTYELCVTAANVCDQAPPTCTTIAVTSPTSTTIVETLCSNECMELAGETICESGLYEFIIPLSNGCDSLIFLDLIILPEIASLIDINLCIGDEFFIGASSFSNTGIFFKTIQTDLGCDSMVTLDLTMIECEINGTSNFISPICADDPNGSLLFSLENGTPPFNYTWKNITNPAILGIGTTNLFSDILIENIPAGVYEILIEDDFGNDLVFIQEIIDPDLLTLEIEADDFNGYNLTCFNTNDGTATGYGNGGVPPYSFFWNTDEHERIITDLSAGIYEVQITDANGCTTTNQIELIAPDPLKFSATYINPGCEGLETGIIQLDTIWGGTPPYLFSLNNDPFETTRAYQDLGPGTYDFSMVDANGCEVDTTGSLSEPDIPELYLEEDQIIDLGCEVLLSATTNNTNLIDINWIDLENSLACDTCLRTQAAPVNDTQFILTVTSIDNCATSDSIFVGVNKIRDVFIPNAFSPNADGINDYFFIYPGKSISLIRTLKVYNRWGALMYAGTNLTDSELEGWDGYFKGELMNIGVYVWTAEVVYLDGEIQTLSGDITLVL